MAKKNTKHGFTLVELIVVLVILAILAALLIPALTGYIDKARKSQVVAETRALTQAVQTEMSTVYALNDEFQRQKSIGKNLTIASKDDDYGEGKGQLDDKLKERYAEIIHLSEVPILEKELESTTGKSASKKPTAFPSATQVKVISFAAHNRLFSVSIVSKISFPVSMIESYTDTEFSIS